MFINKDLRQTILEILRNDRQYNVAYFSIIIAFVGHLSID